MSQTDSEANDAKTPSPSHHRLFCDSYIFLPLGWKKKASDQDKSQTPVGIRTRKGKRVPGWGKGQCRTTVAPPWGSGSTQLQPHGAQRREAATLSCVLYVPRDTGNLDSYRKVYCNIFSINLIARKFQ